MLFSASFCSYFRYLFLVGSISLIEVSQKSIREKLRNEDLQGQKVLFSKLMIKRFWNSKEAENKGKEEKVIFKKIICIIFFF